ncbi:tyrosine-type recombinase/integrase [Argonema galeatum]|uniref:tyrosine-type recombinase/integrase n=1 Tax=Argonema galeatum TaxID=2942762 RepID=UPI002011B7B0
MTVEAHRGMLRLRLPRHLYGGEQKRLYLGLPDTAINREAASVKARIIEADIAFDKFDISLQRYRSPVAAVNTAPLLGKLWEQYEIHKSRTLAASTMDREFKRVARHIAKLPSQRLKDARLIRKYLIENLSAASAKRILMYLSACCEWAVQEELMTANPFEGMPRVKGGKKTASINPFTKVERDQIITAFEADRYYAHYAPFVKFLFLTGARTSEAIGLQWKHISPDLSVITFSEALVDKKRKGTKTGKIRRFPINGKLKSLLMECLPANPMPENLVFESPTGIAIDGHNFLNKAWKTILGSLPIAYRKQYNTRHTFITLCLEANIPVTQVAEWVGNSSQVIWQSYAGLVKVCDVPDL